MGCCYANCFVSGLPIDRGTKVKLFFVSVREDSGEIGSFVYPWDHHQFISLPFDLVADDYIFSSYFDDEAGDWSDKEKKIRNGSLAWKLLEPFIWVKDKSKRDDWFRQLHWEGEAGYNCGPSAFNTDTPRVVAMAPTAVRLDVWNYLMSSCNKTLLTKTKKDLFNFYFERYKFSRMSVEDIKKMGERTFNALGLKDYPEGVGCLEHLDNAFRSFLKFPNPRHISSITLSENEYRKIANDVAEMYHFGFQLFSLGKPIIPMVGLCPQDRYYNKHMKKLQIGFNKFVGGAIKKDLKKYEFD